MTAPDKAFMAWTKQEDGVEDGKWEYAQKAWLASRKAIEADLAAANARVEKNEKDAERIRVAFFEFYQDWKKGDFTLPRLAELDVEAVANVYAALAAHGEPAMSDTPRTDAELKFHGDARSDQASVASGMTMFARQLERDLAAALEQQAKRIEELELAIAESCDEQRGEYFGCRRAEKAEATIAVQASSKIETERLLEKAETSLWECMAHADKLLQKLEWVTEDNYVEIDQYRAWKEGQHE